MAAELKPCHCCQNAVSPKIVKTPFQFYVWCDTYSRFNMEGCGARGGLFGTEEEAIRQWNTRATDQRIAALEAENSRLQVGLTAVSQLIDDSHGVAGLHLNGDVAEWGSLRTGGRFEEWLIDFDKALEPEPTK